MRLITFVDRSARSHIGALAQDGRIVDLNAAHKLNSGDEALLAADMRALFEGGDRSLDAARAALAHAESQRAAEGADGDPVFYRREEINLKAPILPRSSSTPRAIFASTMKRPPRPGFRILSCRGSCFSRTLTPLSADEPVIYPPHLTQELDYELELAVVLKKAGKHFTAEEADDYVGGYVIFNDITARDIQRREMKSGVFSFCKGIDTFCPLGP